MEDEQKIIGRLVDWFVADRDGNPLPPERQFGIVRINAGTRFEARFCDMKGLTRGPKRGSIMSGVVTVVPNRRLKRLVNLEVL